MNPNGTVDQIVTRVADQAVGVMEHWTAVVQHAAEAPASNPQLRAANIYASLRTLPAKPLAELLFRESLRGAMLGALDVDWEIATGKRVEEPLAFTLGDDDPPAQGSAADYELHGFAQKPFEEAIADFKERKSITKKAWKRLTQEQRQDAFTVAGPARQSFVDVVRDAVGDHLREGIDLRLWAKEITERLEEAGFAALNPSHAQLVARQAISTSYSQGRLQQAKAPEVLRTHPYWQISGVDDRTTRPTHEACHGITLPATDPFWARCYPPFGFNCRCNVITRRKGPEASSAAYPQLAQLPDKGYDAHGAGSVSLVRRIALALGATPTAAEARQIIRETRALRPALEHPAELHRIDPHDAHQLAQWKHPTDASRVVPRTPFAGVAFERSHLRHHLAPAEVTMALAEMGTEPIDRAAIEHELLHPTAAPPRLRRTGRLVHIADRAHFVARALESRRLWTPMPVRVS
jgi:SPP1 gp7 family putative phage head morphogenesis protein